MLAKTSRRAAMFRDVGELLTDQLQLEIGSLVPITLKKEKPWASITFSGTRYRFEIGFPEDELDQSLEQQVIKLTDHEFDLPGHFVADFLMHEKRHGDAFLVVEILTIADPVSEKN